MQINRRHTLIGLGSAAAAGGAITSTGAFTSIEADRQVTVAVEGDADAYLALLPYDGPNGSKYATTNGAGALAVTLDKLNPNAVTTIDNVFQVLNQGSQPIAFYVEDGTDAVAFRSEGSSIEGENNAVRLGVGETVTVGMEVDTTNGQGDGDTLLESVTVHAEAEQAPGAQSGSVIYVNDDGTGDFSSIQTAIDDSGTSSGDTIQVAAGSYAGFTIDSKSDLTITGAGGTSNTTEVTGGVTIQQSGTTLSSLRIAPDNDNQASGAAVFIGTPGSDVSGISLLNNVIDSTNQGTENPGGNPEKKHAIKAQTNGPVISGVDVVGNRIQSVVGSGAVTANGVYFEDEGGSFADVRVADNIVDTIKSGDLWAYGIRTNTAISGFTVTGNDVSNVVGNDNDGAGGTTNFDYYYAEGIGIEGSGNTNVTVSRNDISGVTARDYKNQSNGYAGAAVVVSGVSDAAEVSLNQNNFTNFDVGVQSKVSTGTLDATNNWFGTTSGPEVRSSSANTEENTYTAAGSSQASNGVDPTASDVAIDYTPWLDAPFDEGGESFAPVEVNNPSSGIVSVPSFRAGVDALAANGTMRVNGGSGDEFDEGTDTFAIGVSGATIKSTGSGRPTLLNTDTSSGQDYAIRLQADGLRLEGIRVFTDDSADTPKEIRIRANNVTVTDCEVDRGHTAGAGPTEQSGIQVAPDQRTGIGIIGNRLNKAAIGMGGSNVTAKGNYVTNPAAEGIFSVVEGSEGYIIKQNDIDDYDQGNFGLPALKLTDVPSSVNGVTASTAEPYTDEILASNPEVPEVLVQDSSSGSDSRKTQ